MGRSSRISGEGIRFLKRCGRFSHRADWPGGPAGAFPSNHATDSLWAGRPERRFSRAARSPCAGAMPGQGCRARAARQSIQQGADCSRERTRLTRRWLLRRRLTQAPPAQYLDFFRQGGAQGSQSCRSLAVPGMRALNERATTSADGPSQPDDFLRGHFRAQRDAGGAVTRTSMTRPISRPRLCCSVGKDVSRSAAPCLLAWADAIALRSRL